MYLWLYARASPDARLSRPWRNAYRSVFGLRSIHTRGTSSWIRRGVVVRYTLPQEGGCQVGFTTSAPCTCGSCGILGGRQQCVPFLPHAALYTRKLHNSQLISSSLRVEKPSTFATVFIVTHSSGFFNCVVSCASQPRNHLTVCCLIFSKPSHRNHHIETL